MAFPRFMFLGITSAGLGSVLRALGSSGFQVILSRLEGASVLPLKPLDHETKAILGEGRKRFALPPCSVSKASQGGHSKTSTVTLPFC